MLFSHCVRKQCGEFVIERDRGNYRINCNSMTVESRTTKYTNYIGKNTTFSQIIRAFFCYSSGTRVTRQIKNEKNQKGIRTEEVHKDINWNWPLCKPDGEIKDWESERKYQQYISSLIQKNVINYFLFFFLWKLKWNFYRQF